MATNKQEFELYRKQIECPICLDTMRTPKMLVCEHTFCEHCLQCIVNIHTEICCPLCRKQTKVPEQGTSDLPRNLLVVEIIKKYRDILEEEEIEDEDDQMDPRETSRLDTNISYSEALRNRGNIFYKKGLGTKDFKSKENKFKRAAKAYLRALEEAKTDEEKCKAEKNYSMANIQRAEAWVETDSEDTFGYITTYYHLGIKYSSLALRSGAKVMDKEWREDVEQKCREEVTQYLERLKHINNLTDFQRAERLVDIAKQISLVDKKLVLFINALEFYLHDQAFTTTHLQRCQYPLFKVKQIQGKLVLTEQLEGKITTLEKLYISKAEKEQSSTSSHKVSDEKSKSERLRNEGSTIFNLAMAETCLIYKQRGLEDALMMYFRSIGVAKTKDDINKATKNYALAAFNLAETMNLLNASQRSVIHYYWESITYISNALEGTDKSTEQGRYEDILYMNNTFIRDFKEYISKIPAVERGDYYTGLAKVISVPIKQMELYKETLKLYIQESVISREANNYIGAKQILRECTFPLGQLQKLLETSDAENMKEEIDEIKTDIQKSVKRLESSEILAKGEDLVKKAVAVVNKVNRDLLLSASDIFQSTIMMTCSEVDEVETKAYFWLAFIHHQLKNIRAAQDYTTTGFAKLERTSIAVEHLVYDVKMPEFLNIIPSLQKDKKGPNKVFPEEELTNAKTKLSDELKKLNELGNINDKGKEFLKHIYDKHPPKMEKARLASDYAEALLPALDSSTVHYHPDMQDFDIHGVEWKVICTEIAKLANNLLENIKTE